MHTVKTHLPLIIKKMLWIKWKSVCNLKEVHSFLYLSLLQGLTGMQRHVAHVCSDLPNMECGRHVMYYRVKANWQWRLPLFDIINITFSVWMQIEASPLEYEWAIFPRSRLWIWFHPRGGVRAHRDRWARHGECICSRGKISSVTFQETC